MNIPPEYVAMAVCAFAGYAIVSAFFNMKAKTANASTEENCSDAGSDENQRRDSYYNHEENNGERQRPWFDVLDVSPSASLNEIKIAYKIKINGYHPDKVASLALEFRELAEKRSKEINAAYTIAIKIKH